MLTVRDFKQEDGDTVNALVHAAWAEYKHLTPGWTELEKRLAILVEKAPQSEVVVAEYEGKIVGATGYVAASQPKQDFFPPAWPMVRMMSVAPEMRGLGVGGLLLQECIARARRDGAPVLALHTTPIMKHAQRLYAREGFIHHQNLPLMWGVPYVLLAKPLVYDQVH